MSDSMVCGVCGADSRFDERCNVVTHGRHAERAAIVAWLRRGGNEQRARGTVAFEEAVMPMYRELADQIERGEHR